MLRFEMKTYAQKASDINKKWWIIDLKKSNTRVLGRLATAIATTLRGKNKPDFTANLECGDNVILINAQLLEVTGNKAKDKIYYKHTGYFGHLREKTYEEHFAKDPAFVIREAVKGMITRMCLRKYIMRNFYVYTGDDHPHQGQKPQTMEI